MAKITQEDVLRLAKLAKLNLSNEEVDKYRLDIEGILNYVEVLNSANPDGLEPTFQVTGRSNVTRPDVIIDYHTDRQELLKNVPKLNGEYIEARRMIG